jgi:YVTN family beta-propeller protein
MTASAAGASANRTDSGRSSTLNRMAKPFASLCNHLAPAARRPSLAEMLAVLLATALLPAPHVNGPGLTPDTTPTYRLRGGTRFQCSIDGHAFARCRSPWTPKLGLGKHTLRVRALDAHGRAGRSRTLSVTIVPPPPRVEKAVAVGGTPFGVTLAGGSLFAGNFDAGTFTRFDATSGAPQSSVDAGGAATSVAAAADAVWGASFGRSQVVRLDTGTRITVGPGPEGLTYGFGALWTANKGCLDPSFECPGNGSVTRVDPVTGATRDIPVGKEPRYVTAGPTGVWVTSFYSNTLSRIDPATGVVSATVPGPNGPGGVVEAFGSVWVAGYTLAEIWRYDPATLKVTAKVKLPAAAGPEDLDAGGGALWSANSEAGTVSRIDPAANLVTATVRVGLGPRQLAVGDTYLWVSNLEDGTLQRLDF